MKILILNKTEFNNFMKFNDITDENVEEKNVLIISINNPVDMGWFTTRAKGDPKSYFKRNHSNVMIQHFPDYEENMTLDMRKRGVYSVFNERKAKKIYEFIKKNRDKSMAIIHCAGGISRSGAVGAFIYDLYGHETMTWDQFKRKNFKIQPNDYILKLLHEQLKNDKYTKNES